MHHDDVTAWVDRYEQLWRTPGTDRLGELFAEAVVYSPGPWSAPVRGTAALASFWEDEREGADETFTLDYEVLAVEGGLGVVRAQVDYAATPAREAVTWRDLWIIRFDGSGRCVAFEEWPFAPDQLTGY